MANPVESLAISTGDIRDVLGRFKPALNLERRHTRSNQFGQDIDARKILWTEQVALIAERHFVAIGQQFVRHAARLGAFTAIGRAATERLTRQALAGVSDA